MRTKRMQGMMVVSLFLIGLLGACASPIVSDVPSVPNVQNAEVREPTQTEPVKEQPVQEVTVPVETEPVTTVDLTTASGSEHPVPQELKIIPEEYYQAADQQGTLLDLVYDTYESFSYNEKSEPLQKHAVVY